VGTARAQTVADLQVAADGPAQLLQPLCQRGDAGRRFRIVGGQVHEHADAPHPFALLRARRERPRSRRTPEQRDERAALHSMTSSVRCRRRARERSAARPARAGGVVFWVCAMLLLIAAIEIPWMACDEGRQAFTPPRGPFRLHPLVALVLGFVSGPLPAKQRLLLGRAAPPFARSLR